MFAFRSAVRSLSHSNSLIEPINVAFDGNILNKSKGVLVAASAVLNKCSETSKVHQYLQPTRNFSSLQSKHFVTMNSYQTRRNLCTHEITKNLTLFSNKPRNVDKDPKSLRLKDLKEGNPLVIIFSWILARKSHLKKYANIYLELGFDVLTIQITPWQLLWPLKGSQPVAANVLTFLENNPAYKPIVIHGFSVGGYVCGEVMVQMVKDMTRYQPVIDRFIAQIWDSAADITEIPVGFPKAMFPKNPTLEKALRSYTQYHMKTFHEQATTHYIRSSQMFHGTLIKVPALFFLSKTDPIGAEKSNLSVKEDYDRAGIKTTWKCFDRSPHVLHFQKHPEEYKEYLFKHLQDNVLDKIPEKTRAKL